MTSPSSGATPTQLISLVGLFGTSLVQGHLAESYEIAQRSLELSHLHPNVAGPAHFVMDSSSTSLGLHERSVRQLALAHDLLRRGAVVVGTHVEVHAQAWSAHALWLLGHDEDARHWCEWAIHGPRRSTTRTAWRSR